MMNPAAAGILRCALLLACCVGASLAASPAMPGAAQRAADFRQLCDFIGAEYAYFDIKTTDWRATCDTIKPLATAARTRDEFVAALEQALGQLYDLSLIHI